MTLIKDIFEQSRDIHRTIEKVITYGASQEHRLKSEISEYVVTDSIENQFHDLLLKMQTAMESGGENEVGVWVSGFYGSGKSSFTKYLGLAFDESVTIDGVPFIDHLKDRFHKQTTKSLLTTVAKRFPASVVLLDLASEMLAGATMEDVSTVLYYKVLQWAGYSHNLKVAALERLMQKDGRYEEFRQLIQTDLGVEWESVQNDVLVVDSLIPEIAHKMYPERFKTPSSFSTETSDIVTFENTRVEEMLGIVRDKTDKQHIIFIIDEVGQYVGSRDNLILNLDGLAKNLKAIGDGKVWIVGTAQQTLTEDDPRAALNSPQLHKLKDRFPIQIDLESSDIREICYRRLLSKSPEGEKLLEDKFEKFGQSLRHSTKLEDAKFYDSDFNKETFVNLYPFLPAHFDILLHLLGALAKSTGGIGLRSAIKVVQDILVETTEGVTPVAQQPVGWLATTVVLYNSLEKDIRRAFPSIHQSVGKVLIQFPDSDLHKNVAKSVAILQILNNLPITRKNVAGLMQPSIEASSQLDDVEKAVDELINNSFVPFGEQEGNLCFFSEKLNDIEQERAQLTLRSVETRRLFNEILKETFSPIPSAKLDGNLVVRTGLKSKRDSQLSNLTGDREPIQTVVELVSAQDFDTSRLELVDESRHHSSRYMIYLLGQYEQEIEEKIGDIYRCREIGQRHRTDPDQEIKDYCTAQADRATKLSIELQHLLRKCMTKGVLIFSGQVTAIENLSQDLIEANKKHLSDVATQVFDRYSEAPVRAETALAEKFLKTPNLSAITAPIDPLSLVKISGGTPTIQTDNKALVSIRDFIDKNGAADGKYLSEHFGRAPFGWSQDTLRYLIAALLVAGEVELTVSKQKVKVNGQLAIDGLKTNNTFRTVGVALRDSRPSMETLARAASRLTDLVGDMVIPLEDTISKAAVKHLPQFQARFGSLGEKLASLELPGEDKITYLTNEIANLLYADASDAPQALGGEESMLYDSLQWASDVDVAFKNGLEGTLKTVQHYRKEIDGMPPSGVPGDLKKALEDELDMLSERLAKEDFYKHIPTFNTTLTTLQTQVRDAAVAMADVQAKTIKTGEKELNQLWEWRELTQEEQSNVLADLEKLQISHTDDLDGLKQLISQEFVIHGELANLKEKIIEKGKERQQQRLEEEKQQAAESGVTKVVRKVPLPSVITTVPGLDKCIGDLQKLKDEIAIYSEIELTIHIEDN